MTPLEKAAIEAIRKIHNAGKEWTDTGVQVVYSAELAAFIAGARHMGPIGFEEGWSAYQHHPDNTMYDAPNNADREKELQSFLRERFGDE